MAICHLLTYIYLYCRFCNAIHTNMMAKIYILLFCVIAATGGGYSKFSIKKFGVKKAAYERSARRGNTYPVIGISTTLTQPWNLSSASSIPASYIKFLEGAGAKIIPIPATTSVSKLKRLLPHLNGYALTGGY